MAVKRSLWDTILKVVIAVASAVLGALGGNAINLLDQRNNNVINVRERMQFQTSALSLFLYPSTV